MGINFKTAEFLAKTAGATALGLIAIDAHHYANTQAPALAKNHKADTIAKMYLEDRRMDSSSIVRSKLKKEVFRFAMDENFTEFFASAKGYINGATTTVVNNIIPFGLAAGALMTKGFLSKTFGVGLLGYGAIYFLQEILGFGKGVSHQ